MFGCNDRFASDKVELIVDQAGTGDTDAATTLTDFAKVAVAAQTGDQAVIAVLDTARSQNATDLAAFETELASQRSLKPPLQRQPPASLASAERSS